MLAEIVNGSIPRWAYDVIRDRAHGELAVGEGAIRFDSATLAQFYRVLLHELGTPSATSTAASASDDYRS